jgi:transposase
LCFAISSPRSQVSERRRLAGSLRYSPTLALLYDREKQKGNANRATLAVARKLVAYLMSVDRGRCHFLVLDQETSTAA